MRFLANFTSKRGWYLGRRSTAIHVPLYRISGGRIGGNIMGRRDCRIALVDHKGAKSGVKRTSPVIYLADGEDLVIVASRAGHPKHWFHNLVANPETTVQIGRQVREVRARVANDAERDRLWPILTEMFPLYDLYQENSEGRQIPVVILAPR